MATIHRLQAYKFELITKPHQERQMRCFAGSSRFVYNKALSFQKEFYEKTGKRLSYARITSLLPTWKKELDWLSLAPSQALQQSLKNLDNAYKNFFEKRAEFPKFKKKGKHDIFRYPQGVKLEQENNRIFLPKLGWVRYHNSREVLGKIKNVTVKSYNGKWSISIQTEREIEKPYHPSKTAIGLDMGVTRFVTLSDGSYVEPLNSFKRHENRLRKYNRRMSSKKKFSKNWVKAKNKVNKVYAKMAHSRKDFLHKLSTTLSKNHALVVIEDLNISGMCKSHLSKAILDQGWGEFRRQLEYKQQWLGGLVVAVPPHNTSRRCPLCGHVSKENRKTQSKFLCIQCGYSENADYVGAVNVLARGLRVIACGDSENLDSMKQEPTDLDEVEVKEIKLNRYFSV